MDRILLVDDDPNILSALGRHLRKVFDLETALGPGEGLKAVEEQKPFAVIVSDLRMPQMDGIQFLSRIRKVAPDTVRMMLTGNADLEAAIEAVNEGNIFRFLTKPCPPETLTKVLNAGVEQYKLVQSEKELLEKTLRGSVKVLTDIISILSPVAFGRASRVRRIMSQLTEKLGVKDAWRFELAGMLSQTGCVTIPTDTLNNIYQGTSVTQVERNMFNRHPQVGHDLIANIPRLEAIAEIIAYQNKHFNGDGTPEDDVKGEEIPLGARVLHVALEVDTLVTAGKDIKLAIEQIIKRKGWYDLTVVEALESIVKAEDDYVAREITIFNLVTGMILAENVRSESGLLVIAKGQEVTPSLKTRLENFNRTTGIKEPINVLVPTKESKAPRFS